MEPNNNNNINRIVSPIKLDSNGVPITATNKEVLIVEKKKKKISLTIKLILSLILIIGIIILLLAYKIIPDYLSDLSKNREIDRTTTRKVISNTYQINNTYISDNFITYPGEFNINNKFLIKCESTNKGINIFVNNKLITESNYLSNNIGLVHDLMIIEVGGSYPRTNKLYVIDINGDVVTTIMSITSDGMMLDKNSVTYNSSSINFTASKVVSNNLITNSNEGEIAGFNICDYRLLGEKNIKESLPVKAVYSIEYLGNHIFSSPRLISTTSLGDYRDNEKLCEY